MNKLLNLSDYNIDKILKSLENIPFLSKINITSKNEVARFKVDTSVAILYKTGKLLIQGKDADKITERIFNALNLDSQLILGFDESGRGENFGAFVIASVLANKIDLLQLRDSKKTNDFLNKKDLITKNALAYNITVISPELLDLLRGQKLTLDEIECKIIKNVINMFDYTIQKEIIVDGKPLSKCQNIATFLVKADDINAVVGAASILAKYEREQCKNKRIRKSWKNSNNKLIANS